jgi:hypothetical protein
MVFAAFHVGKIAGTVAGGWWLAAQDAARVAARARRLAGISPDLATTGHRGGAALSDRARGGSGGRGAVAGARLGSNTGRNFCQMGSTSR